MAASHARHLEHAARLAVRGRGRVEPNPCVGCVIVQGEGKGEVVGWGYHREFGGPHAEVEAIARAGSRARGATAYVTLEPCAHHGKTPPCAQALIDAGVARVVIAQPDPHEEAQGGAEVLRAAGVEVIVDQTCAAANATSEPFRYRLQTGLPWVIAKWAQTVDGCLATRTGDSKWISNARSRAMVHRERGRVDAILTGTGTVLADDPHLASRARSRRRIARRVVIDPLLNTPLDSRLMQTLADGPVTIVADSQGMAGDAEDTAQRLMDAGAEVIGFDTVRGELPLKPVLEYLVRMHDVTNVLTECGSGVLRRLFGQGLVCEAWVFTAPKLLGDLRAPGPLQRTHAETMDAAIPLQLRSLRDRSGDIVARYRVANGR